MTREEAIKVAYGIPVTKAQHEALQFLIPELAESEDEKTRKEIIDWMKGGNTYDWQKNKEKWITYLEKQEERGPLTKEEEYTLQRIIEYLEDESCPSEWISLLHEIYCLPYEKQKEQKPNYCHYGGDPNIERCRCCSATCSGRLADEQKLAECNEVELTFRGEKVKVKRQFFRDDKGRGYSTTEQDEDAAWNALRAWCEKKGVSLYDLYPREEWSEEDQKALDISCFIIGSIDTYYDPILRQKCLDFLCELPKRFALPPKQEWSEEDKRALNNAIVALSMYANGEIPYLLPSQLLEDVEQLKSLRPQPHTVSIKDATKFGNLEYERGVKDGIQSEKSRHWKPSEEQLRALQMAVDEHWDVDGDALYSLNTELRKL